MEVNGLAFTTELLKTPNVLAKFTEVAPGAETVIAWGTPVTMVAPVAGDEIASAPPAAGFTVYATVLALPNAVAVTLADPANSPDTVVVAVPVELVVAVIAPKPSTVASVAANVTVAPGTALPLASVTNALKFREFPPTVNVVPPELTKFKDAPLICTSNVAALAEQAVQVAVTVATRVD